MLQMKRTHLWWKKRRRCTVPTRASTCLVLWYLLVNHQLRHATSLRRSPRSDTHPICLLRPASRPSPQWPLMRPRFVSVFNLQANLTIARRNIYINIVYFKDYKMNRSCLGFHEPVSPGSIAPRWRFYGLAGIESGDWWKGPIFDARMRWLSVAGHLPFSSRWYAIANFWLVGLDCNSVFLDWFLMILYCIPGSCKT